MTPPTGRREQSSPNAPLQIALPRDVDAPAIARAAVTELCREHSIDGPVRQNVVLLVSEVVSNAVLHSSGPHDAPIRLTASIGEGAVRITVTDAGEGFTPGERDPTRRDGGYGLFLLQKAATRWGVDPQGPTNVWFEIARPG
jgi:anti-sigma regulatory factor (Ser/Thr protein kinase)